jgi:archaellum component FlaF (FlaF/FlaG flagellin family)
MCRTLIAAVLAGAAVAAAPAPASGEPASPYVKLVKCSLAGHEAAFYARMHRLPGGERMAMRFTLLERSGAEGFTPVDAPGLGRWWKSRPGVDAFGYRQGVRNLHENAVYRARVDFRWYSAAGELVDEAHRRSAPCRQFEELPNLRAELVGAKATSMPGVLRYEVRVTNDGSAAAAAVPVRLAVDGAVVDTVTVAVLRPGETRAVGFRAPDCTDAVQAVADPDGAIVELFENDNSHELDCDELPRG